MRVADCVIVGSAAAGALSRAYHLRPLEIPIGGATS